MGLTYRRYFSSGFKWMAMIFEPDFPLLHTGRHHGGSKDPLEHYFKEGHYVAGVLFNPEMKRFRIFTHYFFFRPTPGRTPYDTLQPPKYQYEIEDINEAGCPTKLLNNIKACFKTARSINYNPQTMCNFYLNEIRANCKH